MLRIAEGLSLPDQAVTEKIGVFGISGSGKTNTAGVLVEEMVAGGQHVVICDPLGVCWGLLSSADGSAAGLPLVVFGGLHAHVPLNAEQGREIADVILGERLSAILDLSEFDRSEMTLFMTDFLRCLLRRNAEPLHIVFDEAQLFAPQVPDKQQRPLISAMERLTLTGRVRGLGMTFVSQRPTLVSKNVVSQMGLLIAHKTSHTSDQKTLMEWAKPKFADPADLARMQSDLAVLGKGLAWVVGEIDDSRIAQKAPIRLRQTFDSSATPRVGEQVRTPQTLASVDLTSLQERLASQAEKAAQDDPETLRRHIARLQEELRTQRPPERIEVPILRPEDLSRLESVCESVIAIGKDQVAQGQELLMLGRGIQDLLRTAQAPPVSISLPDAPPAAMESPVPPSESIDPAEKSRAGATFDETARTGETPEPAELHPESEEEEEEPAESPTPEEAAILLTPRQQRMLNTLAAFAALGTPSLARGNLAVLADQSPKSSAYRENLSVLRNAGLVTTMSDRVALTQSGRVRATPTKAPLSRAELHQRWLDRLPDAPRRFLKVLIAAYPARVSFEDICNGAGYSATSSGSRSAVATLCDYGLAVRLSGGFVQATVMLFPKGLQ